MACTDKITSNSNLIFVGSAKETTGKDIASLLRGVETTGECVVETTGNGIASEGLKGPGKSLLKGIETIGEGV